MTATSSETAVLEASAGLAQSIKCSAAWQELASAQKAAQQDASFAHLLKRHRELSAIQNSAQGRRQEELDGKSLVTALVELIAVRDQIQSHELNLHQQKAWAALVSLLQRANEKISQQLGFDFAGNATPHRGGCCG